MSGFKFGVRFLRIFGSVWLISALLAFATFVLSYVGEPPEWNRYDRLMQALNLLWVALLQFVIADYEKRDALCPTTADPERAALAEGSDA